MKSKRMKTREKIEYGNQSTWVNAINAAHRLWMQFCKILSSSSYGVLCVCSMYAPYPYMNCNWKHLLYRIFVIFRIKSNMENQNGFVEDADIVRNCLFYIITSAHAEQWSHDLFFDRSINFDVISSSELLLLFHIFCCCWCCEDIPRWFDSNVVSCRVTIKCWCEVPHFCWEWSKKIIRNRRNAQRLHNSIFLWQLLLISSIEFMKTNIANRKHIVHSIASCMTVFSFFLFFFVSITELRIGTLCTRFLLLFFVFDFVYIFICGTANTHTKCKEYENKSCGSSEEWPMKILKNNPAKTVSERQKRERQNVNTFTFLLLWYSLGCHAHFHSIDPY